MTVPLLIPVIYQAWPVVPSRSFPSSVNAGAAIIATLPTQVVGDKGTTPVDYRKNAAVATRLPLNRLVAVYGFPFCCR